MDLKNTNLLISFAASGTTIIVLLLVLWIVRLKSAVALGVEQLRTVAQEQCLLEHDRQSLQLRLEESQSELARQSELMSERASQILQLERELVAQKAQVNTVRQLAEKEAEHAASVKTHMVKEFELLASRVLEAKQTQFEKSSKDQWQAYIGPFKEQVAQLTQRLEDNQKHDNAQRSQLLGQIIELQKQSQAVGQEAFNLTNALKGGNKIQGQWGELILEHVLQQSGLTKGREYDLQVSHTDESGKRYQPDALIHLPEQREVIVDSKVSLIAYERLVNADSDSEILQAEKQLIDSFKAHIKNLASKSYSDVIDGNTLDFVLMFVPVESAFVRLVTVAPEVLSDAFHKRVAIVSPSSLMAVLKTIESLWSRQKQDENVRKIVESAGKLYDQFVLMVEALDEVGVHLQRTDEAYGKVKKRLVLGRGNLIKRLETIRELGAKNAKQLPAQWVEGIEGEDAESVGEGNSVESGRGGA